jgi:hypothetical protein
MANVTINTNLTNVTDSQSATSASLDGVPFTVGTIISSRIFTVSSNCTFTTEPYVDLSKTSDPTRYTVVDESVGPSHHEEKKTFTVKYNRPLSPPTTDIIQFFAVAKINEARAGKKIHSHKIDTSELHPSGEKRTLIVYGDPSTTLDVHVTSNPKIGPEGNATDIIKKYTATIGSDGKYETSISFPKTTLLTNYRVKLSERLSGSFSGITNPTTITLTQYPNQQVKLSVIDSALSTELPANTVTNRFYYYGGKKGSTTYRNYFSFIVSKSADLALKGTLTSADFTQTTGSTLGDTAIDSIIDYSNLSITINNAVSPNTARVEGYLKINHGYDSGGLTAIVLDINDILEDA